MHSSGAALIRCWSAGRRASSGWTSWRESCGGSWSAPGAGFESGQSEAGLSALTGAFYLLRAGNCRTEMLQGGDYALEAGAAEVSRVGNSGKAIALYGMLTNVLPAGQERQDVQGTERARSLDFGHPLSGADAIRGHCAACRDAAGALRRHGSGAHDGA